MSESFIRVIIAGSRTFKDYSTLSDIVDHILAIRVYRKGYKPSDIEIVCGMANGADTLGEQYAKINQLAVKYFPADWGTFGKSAGYVRNRQMAEYTSYRKGCGALIAFWDGKSKGTKHMIGLAKDYGISAFIYNYANRTWWMEEAK